MRQHSAEDRLIRVVLLNLTHTIFRADFLRYQIFLAEGRLLLWAWLMKLIKSIGGVYADLDNECHKPIAMLTPNAISGKADVNVGIGAD